jgi:hypothetical protein
MEPFFYRWAGKNLPGKHGQRDLIAASVGSDEASKMLILNHLFSWHGIRSTAAEPRRLGRA